MVPIIAALAEPLVGAIGNALLGAAGQVAKGVVDSGVDLLTVPDEVKDASTSGNEAL